MQGKLRGWKEVRDEKMEEEGGRKSRDKKVNKERRYLVDRLEEVGWFIFNGCVCVCVWSYMDGRGESLLDYVLRNEEIWERVMRIEREDKIDSDHAPIEE